MQALARPHGTVLASPLTKALTRCVPTSSETPRIGRLDQRFTSPRSAPIAAADCLRRRAPARMGLAGLMQVGLGVNGGAQAPPAALPRSMPAPAVINTPPNGPETPSPDWRVR